METTISDRCVLNLNNEELDQHIYRIMPEEYVIDIFKSKSNVLTQVHNWKDKFENFQLKLGGILNGQRFTYEFQDDFVGQCWTREYLSEAMWGIYSNNPELRYLRIRSTPRKLLTALIREHQTMPQDTCFIGKVLYKREAELEDYVRNGGVLQVDGQRFAESLLLKRSAFRHESEVRLIYFGNRENYNEKGLYRYAVNPHEMITQIMADPNRDRTNWLADKERLQQDTSYNGEIRRSKIYDPPEWEMPTFHS